MAPFISRPRRASSAESCTFPSRLLRRWCTVTRDHRRDGGPQEEPTEVGCCAALHRHADHRQAQHGGADDDRRVEAGVVERHGEDGKEDEGREAAGGALHGGVGAARDQQQRDRDADSRWSGRGWPSAGSAARAGRARATQATKTARAGPVETRDSSGPDGRAALAWATAASPMKMDARTKIRRRRSAGSSRPVVLFHGGLRWRSISVRSLRTSAGHPVPSYRPRHELSKWRLQRRLAIRCHPPDAGRCSVSHRAGVVDAGPARPARRPMVSSKAPRNGAWPFTSLRPA